MSLSDAVKLVALMLFFEARMSVMDTNSEGRWPTP